MCRFGMVAARSRTTSSTRTAATSEKCSGPAPTFFQLHAVNAYTRSGNISAFEADWAAALGDLKQVSGARSLLVALRSLWLTCSAWSATP